MIRAELHMRLLKVSHNSKGWALSFTNEVRELKRFFPFYLEIVIDSQKVAINNFCS